MKELKSEIYLPSSTLTTGTQAKTKMVPAHTGAGLFWIPAMRGTGWKLGEEKGLPNQVLQLLEGKAPMLFEILVSRNYLLQLQY